MRYKCRPRNVMIVPAFPFINWKKKFKPVTHYQHDMKKKLHKETVWISTGDAKTASCNTEVCSAFQSTVYYGVIYILERLYDYFKLYEMIPFLLI